MQILLLEDDFFLRDVLCELLEKQDYQVTAAKNCGEARTYLRESSYDLAIFDVMLPDGSGVALVEELRAVCNDTPVLFLTACDEEYQIVRGLDAGGDDYVTKPFKMQELLSRVRALLRRRRPAVLQQKGVRVDVSTMSATKDGEALNLTPTEFQILACLMEHPGTVVSRNQLLERIWDCDGNFIDDNTLSVHMSRLREKLGGSHITTVRGAGYKWEDKP